MVYAGTCGQTAQQIADTLHFTLSQERLHPAFNTVDLELARRSSGVGSKPGDFELHIANALWGREGYAFLPEFLATLQQSYGAAVRLVNFGGAAVDAINRWASEQTSGRISHILDTLPERARLVLAYAVYFSAKWDLPFDEEYTFDGPFYLLDGREVATPMMHQVNQFRYVERDGCQAIELPYQGGTALMVIILPGPDQHQEIEARLSDEWVQSVLSGLRKKRVWLTMPKFRFEAGRGLGELLSALGMPDAFLPNSADFSAMAEPGPEPLYIGEVLHKAYIAVDEQRTEAAAVTAVVTFGATPGPSPKEMTIDRPFIFLIRDVETGAILFIGRLMEPTQ
jgi:serpin B